MKVPKYLKFSPKNIEDTCQVPLFISSRFLANPVIAVVRSWSLSASLERAGDKFDEHMIFSHCFKYEVRLITN